MAEESIGSIKSMKSDLPLKPKRKISEKQLNNLKLAREKAAIKRAELGDTTKKENELDKKAKDKLLEERISKIKTLEEISKPSKQKKKIESSSSDSSSEEEEIKPKLQSKPKPKRKPKDKSSDVLAIELSKD